MGVDRELRSSKRQRIGFTCLDVPPINSQSSDQASVVEGRVFSEIGKGRMPVHKTHENRSNDNAAKESHGRASKIYQKRSKRKYRGQTSGNQSSETNGMLEIMNVSPVKKQMCIKNGNASDELFPEHNGKIVDTLLLLNGTNITVPELRLSPASKSKKNQTFISSLKDGFKADIHYLDPGTCNERFRSVDGKNDIERKVFHKLKQYLYDKGLTIGPGWKVQVTGNYPKQYSYFISPDNIKFKSMVTVARHLQDKKGFTGKMENSDNKKPNGGIPNASVCLSANASPAGTIPGNLAMDQVPSENNEQHLCPRKTLKIKGSVGQQEDTVSIVGERGLNRVCNSTARAFGEIERWPLSGTSGLGLDDTQTIDKNILHKLRMINRLEDTTEKQHRHWTEVLERMLKSSTMTAGGLRSCIRKALSSGPPECAKKMLELAISKDASNRSGAVPMKEALLSVLAWYQGEQLSHRQVDREMFQEKPERFQKFAKRPKGVSMNGSERKKTAEKVISSLDLVTERCRNVFLNIISSEKFAALCNLVHGNFAGSRTHELFDFRLINLRMNAGTYGKSPDLFALDMQKLWKNVHEIGQEMVLLADTLSQNSQDYYQKEVASLLEGKTAGSPNFDTTEKAAVHGDFLDQEDFDGRFLKIIKKHCNNEHNSKFVQVTGAEECNNYFVTTSRNMQTDPRSGRVVGERESEGLIDIPMNFCASPGTDGGACRVCGANAHNDCILICDACEAAYHMYCLSPALEEVPSGSWYCPSCYAAGKESSEAGSFNERRGNMPAEENVENVVYHCVVCERLSQMENIQHRRKAEFESDGKEDILNSPGEEVDPDGNKGAFDMHCEKVETEVHGSGQQVELHTDEQEIGEACRVCSTGKRDDDHLIKCSNIKCASKVFHLSCLKPPLETIPPHSWYCPSCLCRGCLVDENDECIILCDGCDDGYHTYCLKPRLMKIPSGKWYCPSCLEKYRRKKGKKGFRPRTNKPSMHVWPKKSKEINMLASGIARETKDPSKKSVPESRSKKICRPVSPSSLAAQKVTAVISGESYSGVTKVGKGVKPKPSGGMKKV